MSSCRARARVTSAALPRSDALGRRRRVQPRVRRARTRTRYPREVEPVILDLMLEHAISPGQLLRVGGRRGVLAYQVED